MFTTLYLQNFKAWKDTGEIVLKPVTMLLGTNSSGKSTLIQSLLLLKQTAQSPDRTVHLNLGGMRSTTSSILVGLMMCCIRG
ncbi:AAA family ATPase [Aquaspirillum sp. LM1]|uniref:AAA family ATPase n=1 Tax=Aquaspirillum sp. LM1 TaxID=1938604 RepID=UPI001C0D1308